MTFRARSECISQNPQRHCSLLEAGDLVSSLPGRVPSLFVFSPSLSLVRTEHKFIPAGTVSGSASVQCLAERVLSAAEAH